MVRTIIFFLKICQGTLYEFSCPQGSILCRYSNGTENSRFWILQHELQPLNCTGKVFGALRPCLSPNRDERQMNLSYMVLLDMWNMFGQKFLSFIKGQSDGWVQQSHLLIINRFERRCPFQYGKDYYIFKKICQDTLYEFSFLQGSFLCPYSNVTENFRFWILQHELYPLNCTGMVLGALRPCLSPYRDECQMILSYIVLLNMWNMFGQKFLSFIGGQSVGRVQQSHRLIINR